MTTRTRASLAGHFLHGSTFLLDMTDDEAFDLTMLVAAGQLDAAGIEKRLRLVPKTG